MGQLGQVGSQVVVVVWLLEKGLLMSCMLAALVEACDTTCPTRFLTYPSCGFTLLLQDHHIGLMMPPFRHTMPSSRRVYSLTAVLRLDTQLAVLIDAIDRLLVLGDNVEVEMVHLDGHPRLFLLISLLLFRKDRCSGHIGHQVPCHRDPGRVRWTRLP